METIKQVPFKRVKNGVAVKLASGKAVTVPNQGSVIFDDIQGSRITISMLNNAVTVHTTTPEIPGGIRYEFQAEELQEGAFSAEQSTLEGFVSSLRCQANGRL